MNNRIANVDVANEESNYFVIFPTRLLETCSHRQAILMGMLISLSNRYGYCYAKNKTLSSMLSCSEISVKRDLRHLEEVSLISRHIIRKKSGEVLERKIYVLSPLSDMLSFSTPPVYQFDSNPPYQNDTHPPYQNDPSNSNKKIQVKDNNKSIEDTFEFAWKTYTRKGVKKTALRSWNKLSSKKQALAIAHIPLYIKNHEDHNKMPYLPHFATYINQERWEDSLPYGSDEPRNIDWG